MNPRLRFLLLLTVIALLPRVSWALPQPKGDDGLTWRWEPAMAYHPVNPRRLEPAAPFVVSDAPWGWGPFEVGPDRAALVWLDAFETVRARATDGNSDGLIFRRLDDSWSGTTVLDQAGVRGSDGHRYFTQPPGKGGMWLVTAQSPARVLIERTIPRAGRSVWEATEELLIGWIDGKAAFPAIPAGPLRETFIARARGLRELEASLIGQGVNDKRSRRAIRQFVTARLLAEFGRLWPTIQPHFSPQAREHKIPDVGPELRVVHTATQRRLDPGPRPHRLVEGDRTFTLQAHGPGVLRIEARPLSYEAAPVTDELLRIAVKDERGLLDVGNGVARPAWVQLPGAKISPVPERDLARTDRGHYVANPVVLSVPLKPGRHEYEVALHAGLSLSKITRARRRMRAGPMGRGQGVGALLRRAKSGVRKGKAPVYRFIAYQIDSDMGHADAPGDGAFEWVDFDPALEAYVAVSVARDPHLSAAERRDRALAAAELLSDTFGDASALEIMARLDLSRILLEVEAFEEAAAVLLERVEAVPLGPLLDLAIDPDTAKFASGPVVAAMMASANVVPVDGVTRRKYVEVWRRTRWQKVRNLDSAPVWGFIELRPPNPKRRPQPVELKAGAGRLWWIPEGRTVTVVAPPPPYEKDRRAVFRAHFPVKNPGEETRPLLGLKVGESRFSTAGIRPLETFEIGVTPGPHLVRVSHPEGAFVNFPPQDFIVEPSHPAARGLRYWSAKTIKGEPTRFLVGPSTAGGVARIRVGVLHRGKWEEPEKLRPVRATLRTDTGQRYSLELRPGAPGHAAQPDGAPGVLTHRSEAWVSIDADVTSLTIEGHDGAELAVVVDTRIWEPEDPEFRPDEVPAPVPDPNARITALSGRLLRNPNDIKARVERGHRLLEATALLYARQDLLYLLTRPHDVPNVPQRRDVRILADRLDAYTYAAHADILPVVLDGDEPELIGPPVAALIEQDSGRITQLAGKKGERTPLDPIMARAIRAHALERTGDPARAALEWGDLYVATGLWQLGYASARRFLDAFDGDGEPVAPDGAGFAWGLAVQLEDIIDVSAVRLLKVLAARLSRADYLSKPQSGGKAQWIVLPRRPALPEPYMVVREALLRPPWSHDEATMLSRGRMTRMPLETFGPRELAVDGWCQPVRHDIPGADGRVQLDIAVDGKHIKMDVSPGTTRTYSVPELEAGKHVVEISMPKEVRDSFCSVRIRFVVRGVNVVRSAAGTRWLRVEPDQPLEAMTSGPVTLRIDARHLEPPSGKVLEVEAIPADGSPPQVFSLPLPQLRDPKADLRKNGQEFAGLPARGFLLLAREVPYKLVVRSRGGPSVLRLAYREDKIPKPAKTPVPPPPSAPPAPGGAAEAAETLEKERHLGSVRWPDVAPTRIDIQAAYPTPPPRNRFGTLTFMFGFGRDDVADADDIDPAYRVQGSVQWRRLLIPSHLWIRSRAIAQWRDSSGGAGGGDLALYWQLRPRGTRGTVRQSFWGQTFRGSPAWSSATLLRVERAFTLHPSLWLTPGVQFEYRYQSLDRADTVGTDDLLHTEVYTDYREDHPIAFAPDLILRWMPLQDQLGSAGVSVVPNSNFESLDQVNFDFGWVGVVDTRRRVVPGWRAGYQASLRLQDENRDEFFVRNRLSFGANVSIWMWPVGRLVVDLRDVMYISGRFPLRNSFWGVVYFDLSLGRGLDDRGPAEMVFKPQHDPRWWRAPKGRKEER